MNTFNLVSIVLIVSILSGIVGLMVINDVYALTPDCYSGKILSIVRVDGLIICLDNRINDLQTQVSNITAGADLTTASNLGSVGEGVFASEIGNDLQFKKLTNGTGIILSANGTRIMINSTAGGGDSTTASNLGTSGQAVFSSEVGNDLQFKKIHTIDSCLLLTNNSTNVNVDSLEACEDKLIGKSVGEIFQSLVKTNIGTSYIDIYTSAFDQENKMIFSCANVTYIRVIYQWDYVGTGSQQLRWVDINNNANVFYESPTFITDKDPADSFWIVKPSWCIDSEILFVTLEQQGKSTTAGDDPVAKGYKIMVK